jgi:rfaE bifunctional protein nucleotidyltransferase chain/domain/rfaE bifunctional protein kinase chain/domain
MSPASGGPVVVVGDALLDVDLVGTVNRLCPDAPVPVLDAPVEHLRPGGAGLSAQLLADDGHEVVLVTALCADAAAKQLLAALNPAVRVIAVPSTGQTPVKQRIRADGQSLLRVDTGGGGEPGELPAHLEQVLHAARAVVVADYGRGMSAHPQLRRMLAGLPRQVPVVWDPHPRGASPVTGARLVTPNLAEAVAMSDVAPSGSTLRDAGAAAAALVERWSAAAVAVTLGGSGALVSHGYGAPAVVPAPDVHCIDPCGAGDRFASAAAVALGAGSLTTEAVQEAVLAASAFVASGGAAGLGTKPPAMRDESDVGADAERLAQRVRARGGTVVATGGCFDLLHAGHIDSLRAARGLGDCLVVCLNSDRSVARLKGPDRPVVPQGDRARVLLALEHVDAVLIFDEDTPEAALQRLRPHVWAKGGDYSGSDLPEARVLAEWDGDAVVLPYLQGRSTSGLVSTVRSLRETSP